MKANWILALLLATAAAPAMAQSRGGVVHVDSERVDGALAGRSRGTFLTGANFSVMGIHRTGKGEVEVHETQTDIFYITDGEATIVTGGKAVGGKQTAPHELRGGDIQGGQTQKLKKGDLITIPAGVPHWFKEVSPSISYLTVKVDK